MSFDGLTRKLEESEKILALPDGDVQLGNKIYKKEVINPFIKYKIGKNISYSLLDRASTLIKIRDYELFKRPKMSEKLTYPEND